MITEMIYPIILSVLSIVFLILIGIFDEKNYKVLTSVLLINVLGLSSYLVFNEYLKDLPYYKEIHAGHMLVNLIIFLLMIGLSFYKGLFSKNHYQLFIKSIKKTKWNAYYVIDKKTRIKEMSDGLAAELGFTKAQVIGKPLFDVFNRSIRITSFNGVDTNNRALEIYYEEYEKNVTSNQQDENEILFQNFNGKTVMFHTVEQPVFIFGKYKGRISIGEIRSDFNLLGVEKTLLEKEQALESLRLKYIATLSLVEDGLFYIDLDQRYVWGSDQFVKMTGLLDNTIDMNDFRQFIHKDDLNTYLAVLGGLTQRKQTYKMTYRFLYKHNYIWLRDTGTRIFEDSSSNIILGSITVLNQSSYQKTSIKEIDELLTENDLFVHLDQLIESRKHFQLAMFELTNIPQINETAGRVVGNMLIAEYLKKLRQTFMSESSAIFRLSGLVFAVTLIDPRKMDILKQGVNSSNSFLNLQMNYGHLKTEVQVSLGVSSSYQDGQTSLLLQDHAKKALGVAKNPNYNSNSCYYKDISG